MDWFTGELDPDSEASLAALNAEAALLIGDFTGSCDTVPTIALYFSIDEGAGRSHWLMPLVTAPPDVYDTAVAAAPVMIGESFGLDPCFSDTHCEDTYRQRLKDAIDAYGACMASSVPPVSIWNVACFVGCTPLLAATPIAYAICVAGCNLGVSAHGTITLVMCSGQLEAAKANALQSYCACLAYKDANCPDYAEVDIHGCP